MGDYVHGTGGLLRQVKGVPVKCRKAVIVLCYVGCTAMWDTMWDMIWDGCGMDVG